MKEKLFIPLNATKSTGTSSTSPTERPNKSIELGKWINRFLGISPTGASNLVLNQQGNWSTINTQIIESTKSLFLDNVSNQELQFPCIYKITDIANGLYINSLSENSFSFDTTISLFVPEYEPSGINLGQLNANDLQTVNDGEKVIWADHYWINNSGSPVTPTIIDWVELDSPMTLIDKSNTDYIVKDFPCVIDADLNIYSVTNPFTNSSFTIATRAGFSEEYIHFPLNNPRIMNTDLKSVSNHYIDFSTEKILSVYSTSDELLCVNNNSGAISFIKLSGTNNRVENNVITDEGVLSTVELTTSSTLSNNTISGNKSGNVNPTILAIELFDFCSLSGNTLSGDGSSIYDVRTGENSTVDDNTFTGEMASLSDIDQMYEDHVNSNEILGNFSSMTQIWQNGYSEFNENSITGDNAYIRNIWQEKSTFNNFSISSDGKTIERVTQINSNLSNGADISIKDFKVTNIDIDFTGFSHDVSNETIEAGKGWFTLTYDFATNPITVGNKAILNLIPYTSRIVSIKSIGNISGGLGAVLDIGLETDEENLLSDTVGNYSLGKTYTGYSAQAIANRGLSLKASFADITGGVITILVEFII